MDTINPPMTGICAIKAGFFLLRPCSEPMVATCACCLRPVCLLHTAQVEEQTWCTECAATRNAAAQDDNTQQRSLEQRDYRRSQDDGNAVAWAYQFRHHYFRSSGIHSIALAERGFNEEDAAAFENVADVNHDASDSAAADLFDS